MASKRGAGSELTDRNWDQEEEPEDAGNFKQADDTSLKQRVIKTAKRRGTSLGAGGSGAFSGFGGFGASAPSALASVAKPNVSFSFGSFAPAEKKDDVPADKPAVSFSFGSLAAEEKKDVDKPADKPAVNFSFGNVTPAASKSTEEIEKKKEGLENGKPAASSSSETVLSTEESSSTSGSASSSTDAATAAVNNNKASSSSSSNDKAKAERKYLAHVKTLNKSVLAWIQKHVEDRPTCILTPVFEDYEKHLKRIEERFGVVPSDNEDSEPETASSANEKPNMASEVKDESAKTATTNGDHDDKHDTYSATKTRFTCTTPSQAAARGLDASLKEIDSKDRAKKDEAKEKDEPKLTQYASFSAIKTNHTFSYSNLSHARAPTSSCNSSMKPTFSFCVSSSEKPSETFTTSVTPAAAAAAPNAGAPPASSASGLFSFGSGGSSIVSSSESNKGIFSFGSSSSTAAATSSSSETNKGIFSFGSSSSSSSTSTATTSSASTFSFGGGGGGMFGGSGGSGFSFGSSVGAGGFTGFAASVAAAAAKPANGETKEDGAGGGGGGDDEEYVPPKPEIQEISEDDAIFTKRCKLFYKKDGAFVDRGVGNLFIKPITSGEGEGDKKFSLLVRADTNLGNILLNISLNSLKFSAMGAKDVSFLCVPNPLPDPKMAADQPVIMLLRVKDTAIRDEVLDQLNTHA